MAESKKKILIIEDEDHVKKYLSMVLRDAGYETISAEDGQTGFETAKSEPPDLIVLDLMMPNKTGTDFARRMSREASLKAVPIIVVSGLAGRELSVRHPAAVFDKPPDRDAFLSAVRKALG